MRHRRPAECRQVDALQCADADRGGAGGQLSVLHHRAECRRDRRAGPAAGKARGTGQIGGDHSDAHHLRRYRRAGARRLEGRGARQPVSRHHPRGRRHRACGALFRGRRRHPCRGQDRPDRRHRHHRDRTDAGRSRQPGKARRRAGEKSQRHRRGRQVRQGNARSDQPLAGAAARRQAGAPGRAQAGRGKAVPFARPAHFGAGALCLQCRGSLRRDRQRLLRARSKRAPRKKARSRW